MFIGHYAAGLASKKLSSSLSLPIIFIAVQFLDLLWPLLVILGIETVAIEEGITKISPLDFTFYPYSHSLLMILIWGILFGVIYFLFTKNRHHSLILGGLVISHWFLDLIVHRPDLPLTPFSDFKIGLGMWNYPVAEIIIELSLFIVGTYMYYTQAKPTRKIAFFSLILVLLFFQAMNF